MCVVGFSILFLSCDLWLPVIVTCRPHQPVDKYCCHVFNTGPCSCGNGTCRIPRHWTTTLCGNGGVGVPKHVCAQCNTIGTGGGHWSGNALGAPRHVWRNPVAGHSCTSWRAWWCNDEWCGKRRRWGTLRTGGRGHRVAREPNVRRRRLGWGQTCSTRGT